MTTRQDPPHDEDCLCREAERTARGLDGLEAMLGDDGLTREERVHRAVESLRADHEEWQRTRQPWRPVRDVHLPEPTREDDR